MNSEQLMQLAFLIIVVGGYALLALILLGGVLLGTITGTHPTPAKRD